MLVCKLEFVEGHEVASFLQPVRWRHVKSSCRVHSQYQDRHLGNEWHLKKVKPHRPSLLFVSVSFETC